MSGGLSVADALTANGLFTMYSMRLQKILNLSHSILKHVRQLGEDEVNFDGTVFTVTALNRINESYSAVYPGGALPPAQTQQKFFLTYKPKAMYNSLAFDTFAGMKGSNGAMASDGGNLADEYKENSLISFMANIAADVYLSGVGYRAKCTVTPGGGDTSFVAESLQYIRPGMILDVYDSTYTIYRGTVTISDKAMDFLTHRAYLTTAVPAGMTAGDVLVVTGALSGIDPAQGNKYLTGFLAATDNSASLGNVNASTYALWQAVTQDVSGANPTQELLQLQWDLQEQISETEIDLMCLNTAQKRPYLANYLSQRMFPTNNYNTGAADLSFSPVKMGTAAQNKKFPTATILEDLRCPVTTMFFMNTKALGLAPFYQKEPGLANEDGRELRFVPGYDSLTGFNRFWAEMVYFKRNALGAIKNLAVPNGVI